MQGETLLQPIGITAKKAKSINFGPINFKSNNWANTKCNYYRIWFSLTNFSLRSAAIFCLNYFRDPFTNSSASKSQLSNLNNKASKCSGRLDELTHFPHSAWSSHAITESQSLRWFSRLYSLATFTCLLRSFSIDVRKMLIALKGWDTFHQHHFIFLITFNASILQRELDAPNPTPNQSTRLTLPKQGATLRLLKNDRQMVKRNMEKLSPFHAKVWENYSKKSIENQSLNKFDKKHNTLIFHQEKRFREFCQQASTWNT